MSKTDTTRNWRRMLWSAAQAIPAIIAWQLFDWRAAACCLVVGVMCYTEGKWSRG
jgi:hypothetical protein